MPLQEEMSLTKLQKKYSWLQTIGNPGHEVVMMTYSLYNI